MPIWKSHISQQGGSSGSGKHPGIDDPPRPHASQALMSHLIGKFAIRAWAWVLAILYFIEGIPDYIVKTYMHLGLTLVIVKLRHFQYGLMIACFIIVQIVEVLCYIALFMC